MWEIWKEDQYVGITSSLQIAQIAWERGLVVYYHGNQADEKSKNRNLTINQIGDILYSLS